MAIKEDFTAEDIKYLAGWNEVTFKLNLTKGLQDCRIGNDRYDPRKFFVWYRDNVYRPQLSGESGEDSLDILTHRARYEKARAQKYEIKLNKLREQYVTLEETEYALMEMCETMTEIAEVLPELLSKEVVNKNEDEMLILTDRIVRELLLTYSKLGADNEGSEAGTPND